MSELHWGGCRALAGAQTQPRRGVPIATQTQPCRGDGAAPSPLCGAAVSGFAVPLGFHGEGVAMAPSAWCAGRTERLSSASRCPATWSFCRVSQPPLPGRAPGRSRSPRPAPPHWGCRDCRRPRRSREQPPRGSGWGERRLCNRRDVCASCSLLEMQKMSNNAKFCT